MPTCMSFPSHNLLAALHHTLQDNLKVPEIPSQGKDEQCNCMHTTRHIHQHTPVICMEGVALQDLDQVPWP